MLSDPAAQARFDDEISAPALMLCNFPTQRNTFSLISRLPPEILAHIFIHYAQSYKQNGPSCHSIPDWVNVSYVCRHWRGIALNCSTLWSFLFASSDHWTNELLARSKTAPLKIRMDTKSPRQTKELEFLEKMIPQAYRIQELCLRVSCREARRIFPLFSSSAPLLQTLEISVDYSGYAVRVPPRTLFDGDIPVLRELELKCYAFQLTSTTLCGLKHLRLRDLGASYRPTLEELKVALGRMQNLEHLHLENALPSVLRNSIGESFDGSEKLSFPRLSRLSIIAPSSTVTLLLSCFDLPLKTKVRLQCGYDAGEDHARILPHLEKRFIVSNDRALDFVPIIRTCLIEAASAIIGFVFSATGGDYGHHAFLANKTYSTGLDVLREDWDDNIPLKVNVTLLMTSPTVREDIIGGMCRSMPLTNLQSAHISLDNGTDLSSDFWIHTFGHLEELKHLKLSLANLQGLVEVLSFPSYHSPHHSQKNAGGNLELQSYQVFAPALEELQLCGVDFFLPCHMRWAANPIICSRCVQCLYDALARREAEGYGVERLIFENCTYVCNYDLKGLRELGIDVDWDGVSRTLPGFDSEEDKEHSRRGG